MLDTNKIVKVSVICTTIISIVCVLFVWTFPAMSVNLINMTMHSRLTLQEPTLTFGGVIVVIIMWDIIIGLISWLFCTVYNKIK